MNILKFARASFAVVALSVASAGWAHISIDVNQGNFNELTKIRGIGGYTSHTIILERETQGKYQSWSDFFNRLGNGIIRNVTDENSKYTLTLDGKNYLFSQPKSPVATR